MHMKKIAIYGKGGIGKSTTTANISAALAQQGEKVCQIGCDPKNDSTRLLLHKICHQTVLDEVCLKDDDVTAEDVVHTGFASVTCIEAGGPEPGVGCAGRGIIVALEKLKELSVMDDTDIVIYDVLGDVVCGGFAVPIANRGSVRLGGLILNSRLVPNEEAIVQAFADRLGTKVVAVIPRDTIVQNAEVNRQTVIEYAPDSNQSGVYRELAAYIKNNKAADVPKPLTFEELEELVYSYGRE